MAVKSGSNFEIFLMCLVFLLQCQFSLSQQDGGLTFNDSQLILQSKFKCHETILNEKLSLDCWCKSVNPGRYRFATVKWSLQSAESVDVTLNRTKTNENVLKLLLKKIRIDLSGSPITSDYNDCNFLIFSGGLFPDSFYEIGLSILFNADYPSVFVNFNMTCLKSRNSIRKGTSEIDVSECKWNGPLTRILTVKKRLCSNETESRLKQDLYSDENRILDNILNYWDTDLLSGCDTNFSEFAMNFFYVYQNSLPRDILKKLSDKKLQSLRFQGIKMKSIKEHEIPTMDSLEKLDLSYSDIPHIHRDAFTRVINLRVLILRNNQLKAPFDISRFPKSLRFLDLRSNIQIEHQSYVDYNFGVSELETLLLSDCALKKFSPKTMNCRFPSLKHLDLSYNQLDTVDNAFLANMTQLESLDLSFNRLIHIPYNVILVSLPNLKHFYLGGNGINELLALTNAKMSVRVLDLSSNLITSWREPLVDSLSRSLILNLSRNEIDEVNSIMIQDFDRLNGIYLSGNKFDCNSCSLEKFLAWLNSKNTLTDFPEAPYLCHSPVMHLDKNIKDVTPINCEVDLLLVLLLPVAVLVGVVASCAITYCRYRERIRYCNYVTRRMIRKDRLDEEDASSVYRHDAFVSYCSADEEWVGLTMVPEVENENPKLHLNLHGRDFVPGVMITENIIASIEESRRCVFIITPKFIASSWCTWELEMAKHRLFDTNRGKLILIILEEIDITKAPRLLRVMMKTETYLIWPKNEAGRKLFWRRFKDAIGECRCVQGRRNVEESSV